MRTPAFLQRNNMHFKYDLNRMETKKHSFYKMVL